MATQSIPISTVAAPDVRKGNPVVLGIFAVVALIAISYGVQRWSWGRTHVSTDNAQVEGHVVPTLSKVSGYVLSVGVNENQTVKAGELMVQLDDREYRARLAQAEGDLQNALALVSRKGHVGQSEAQVEAAKATVAQAAANADRARNDADRYRSLSSRGVVSKQQYDNAVSTQLAAEAALTAARKQVQAAQAGEAGASARVAAMQAARDRAALDLSYTRITAPVSGVVSRKTIEVGQLVQAGQPTMSVVPLDDVWVVANLKETELAHVIPGDPVEIEVDAYGKTKFEGQVESISPATGAKFSLLPPDNATGNFTKVVQRIPVRIRVENKDAQHPLRPGMSVTATVRTR